MSEIKNGGPAFPTDDVRHNGSFNQSHEKNCAGMSLRDYFAAAALQALISKGIKGPPQDLTAVVAYTYADAMLAERSKP